MKNYATKSSEQCSEHPPAIRWAPATGKPNQRSVYDKTQREVRQQITAILSELGKGMYQAPSKWTVGK